MYQEQSDSRRNDGQKRLESQDARSLLDAVCMVGWLQRSGSRATPGRSGARTAWASRFDVTWLDRGQAEPRHHSLGPAAAPGYLCGADLAASIEVIDGSRAAD